MKSQKSILLSLHFFSKTLLLLWKLHEFYDLDGDTLSLCDDLSKLIENKFEALNKRNAFSDYKAAPPGSPEREAFRRAYLDISYTPIDWRPSKESLCSTFYDDDLPF